MHTFKTVRGALAPVVLLGGVMAVAAAAPLHAQQAAACSALSCDMGAVAPAALPTLTVGPLAATAAGATAGATAVPAALAPAVPAFSAAAESAMMQDGRTLRWEGAAVGFVAGAAITWYALNTNRASGGSTAPCNRRRNQDAWPERYCAMAVGAGGLVLAPVGYVIGSRIRVGSRR